MARARPAARVMTVEAKSATQLSFRPSELSDEAIRRWKTSFIVREDAGVPAASAFFGAAAGCRLSTFAPERPLAISWRKRSGVRALILLSRNLMYFSATETLRCLQVPLPRARVRDFAQRATPEIPWGLTQTILRQTMRSLGQQFRRVLSFKRESPTGVAAGSGARPNSLSAPARHDEEKDQR